MNTREVTPLLWPSDALLHLPGSKSEANRLLVTAALSGQRVTVHGASPSDDVRHLVRGLATLGFEAAFVDEASGIVQVGPRAASAPDRGEVFCGNAGTTLRFLVSVAAITPGEWTITGDAAMQRRPIGPLVAAWRQLGVEIDDTNGCPPVRIRCREVPLGGRVRVAAHESSQFVSSLMLVAASLPRGLDIEFPDDPVSRGYVDLTRMILEQGGVRAKPRSRGITIPAGRTAPPKDMDVRGDWSSAGVWVCLNHLTGSRVVWSNHAVRTGQPDENLFFRAKKIPGTGDHTIDVGWFPDQFMNLAILAAHRAGTTRLVGGTNLRIKESDRIAVMARELGKVGVDVAELPDGLVVRGGKPLRAAVIDPENDHRVAMAFALAGLLSPGISIGNPECVTKSYPGFWSDLETVRTQRRCVAVVGMRGAGKSTFGRALAERTGSAWHDTDALFVAEHGPIAAFVAEHGWPAFRAHERDLVRAKAVAGSVLGLGGGAIETREVRRALDSCLVVWLDGDAALLRSRIAADATSRPSVTGAPVLDEIPALLERRKPLYAAGAHVRIDAALPTGQQVELALRAVGASCRWPGSDTTAASP